MCGRIVRKTARGVVAQDLELEDDGRPDRPRFNIAPGSEILAVRVSGNADLELANPRWGLIPWWAKDEKIAWNTINARSETVAESPAYRDAFKKRRCVIPVDGYYEWKATPEGKIPYFIQREDEHHLYLAGLWEQWKSPSGDMIETCTIITKGAESELGAIHNRMPVIVPRESCAVWLILGNLKSLLTPESSVELTTTRVRPAVNNPKYDCEDCLVAA